MTISQIQNYYQISDRLATSGQPTADEFALIAQAGYKIIINLAMSCSTNAILNRHSLYSNPCCLGTTHY